MSDTPLGFLVELANLVGIAGDRIETDAIEIPLYDDAAGVLGRTQIEPWEALLQLLEDAGIPPDAFDDAEAALTAIVGKVTNAHAALKLALEPDSNGDRDAVAIFDAIKDAVKELRDFDSVQVTSEAPPADEIAVALLEHLVVRHLLAERPRLYYLLALVGVIDASAYRERRTGQLRLDRLDGALGDPAGTAAATFGWGTPDFDSDRVMRLVAGLARAWGARSARVVDAPLHDLGGNDPDALDDADLDAVTITIARGDEGVVSIALAPLVDADGHRGLVLFADARAAASDTIAVGDEWELGLEGDASSAADAGVVLHPENGWSLDAVDDGALPDVTLQATLVRTATDRIGILEIEGISITAGGASAQGRLEMRHSEPGVGIVLRGIDGRVDLEPFGDGFVRSLMPDGASAGFSPEVGWNTRDGFHVGGSGLSVRIPLELDLAALLRLDLLEVSVRPTGARLDIDLGFTGAATLGPVAVVLAGLGLRISTAWDGKEDPPVEATVRFLPPRGAGVEIDAGPVSGGGFVDYDPDDERYVGALSLRVDELGIGAFGVLDTKLPGSDDGWSLLLFIFASFPAVQLGFGFTLNGVGGIVGIHRGLDVDALFAAVRAGTAGRLLAPENPVRDAPTLARDAARIFPVQRGQHTLGPSMKLGWGTPTLVELDVALAVSLPDPLRIVVIGSLHAAIPHEDAAIVLLNVDVAGVLDLSSSRMDAEGRLYDSHVQLIPIQGGFALRSSWGRTKSLAFSVGGLHPRYTPPPGFPELERLGTDLSRGSLKVRLWGYFAVTSNSLQLGAGVDLRFAAKGFVVEGGLAFDALVLLDPFGLDVSLRAWVSVSHEGDHLLSLRLKGRLTGPNAWKVKGSVHIEILFFDVGVGVEATFGRREDTSYDPRRVSEPLQQALSEPTNWDAAGPATSALVLDEMSGLLSPDADPAVSQRTAPLEIRIDKFQAADVAGPRRFRITAAAVNGQALPLGEARLEDFAPGDFLEMTEAERLSAPSFERMASGVSIRSSGSNERGSELVADTSPEVIVIDEPDAAPRRRRRVAWPHDVPGVRRGVAAARTGPLVTVEPERWTSTTDSQAGPTWAAASQAGGEPALEAELA